MKTKPTDCVLFINEDMARLVIAWVRLGWTDASASLITCDKTEIPEIKASYSPKQLADVLGVSAGQVKGMIRKAVAVGILEMNGEVSDLAQKCVNGIISKKIQEFK